MSNYNNQHTIIEDINGKTVEFVYDDESGEYITIRFTDKTFLHISVDQQCSCSEQSNLSLWNDPMTAKCMFAAGLIDEAGRDKMLAEKEASKERNERAQLERLKRKYEGDNK